MIAGLGTFRSDARNLQIAALSALLAIQFVAVDFGATPINAVCAIGAALATQALFDRGAPFEPRSALITGLSLTLLLRAAQPGWLALAGVLAIASKYLLRFDGRPIFNPSALAIAALLTTGAPVWISPGQWGAYLWFAALIVCLAALVLPLARRADIALYFLGVHLTLLVVRAAWLGDPLAIPRHQFENGSLLVFAAFMITDPRTTPKTSLGRFLFAAMVASLAHWLAFFEQARPALYFALVALNPFVMLIDRACVWATQTLTFGKGASAWRTA